MNNTINEWIINSEAKNSQMDENQISQLITKSFTYFGLALAVAAAWSYAWLFLASAIGHWPLFIIAIVIELWLIFTSNSWTKKWNAIAIPLFILFAFASGLTLYPILAMSLSSALGMQILIQAFLSSAGLFTAMWIYWYTTNKDLTKIWTIAFFAFIVLIVVMIINFFIGSSMVSMIASGAWIIIFSIFTAWDIQKIKEGLYDSAIMAAIALYLDFINLFVMIYHLLMSLAWNNE